MSASTTPLKKKKPFQSKTFWLLGIFIIYSIFGGFILPKIIASQLKENLKSIANWDTRLDNISFNPYALSVEVSGAEIVGNQDQPVLSFERLFINFSLLQSLGGTISFDEISLAQPVVHLNLDENGTTNFQHAFATDAAVAKEEVTEEESDVIALFFDLIAISSGKIYLSDDSQGENFKLSLEPLSLSLEGFSTVNNERGDYELSISLSNDQAINWHGQIGVAPFQSKGHLVLHNIESNTFWHYAKEASPYWLNQAHVSFSGDYDTTISDATTLFNIENSELVIENASLSEMADEEAFLAFKSLKLSPISFDLTEQSLDLGHIELNKPQLLIERAPDSSLNILRPLASKTSVPQSDSDVTHEAKHETPEDITTSVTPNEERFHWQISDIKISEGQFNWRDLALAIPAELSLDNIDISLGALSDDLSQSLPYALAFSFVNTDMKQDSPSLSEPVTLQKISGTFSPLPFKINGDANLTKLALASLQSYVSESANLSILQGNFSLQSRYDLSLAEQLEGTMTSSVTIDDLAINDSVLSKPLSGFKQLAIGPVSIVLPAQSEEKTKIDIESIILDQPYGDVFIAENGQVNLSQLAKNTVDHDQSTDEEAQQDANHSTDSSEKSALLDIILKRFDVKKGKFTYTDASLKPAFTTQLSEFEGSIEGISSDLDAQSKVSFSGKVDSQGKLIVKGTLNPLSQTPNTDIQIKVNNINMSMASPYSAKYAGYQIEKGKLDLDLNYHILDKKLNASNQILLNQFKFGKSVDSPDATSLPLPLAVGMLKDMNGKIDIDLPISGDLDDPSFKISSVIFNTFVNLITKAVTSPFSMLGSLIEGSDDISEVQFLANSSTLSAEQTERILTLSKALKKRPDLTLEIRGLANANIDQLTNAQRQDHELLQLANDRAHQMSKVVLEQGQIDASRVFILEPEIIALIKDDTAKTTSPESGNTATVTSKFTLGVR